MTKGRELGELIITNPRLNRSNQRDYTYLSDRNMYFRKAIPEDVQSAGISSEKAKILDICAGNGSGGRILTDAGFDPKNIVCVDTHKPNPNLIEGCTWKHWDMKELVSRLCFDQEVPDEISEYRGKFDVVLTLQTRLDRIDERIIGEYFVKKGGGVVIGIPEPMRRY